jgi:NAD-dependent dihydropyrimidine dehydrogenase PreA subunit
VFKYVIVNIVETLLRVLPLAGKTGLIKIGNPHKNAPVFLTCNYHLTVQRVKRSLQGLDCFLLVASSKGINVWCAAAGGHLTHHEIISVLKTSGIEQLVDHRNLIMPQLAATGVVPMTIKDKTGWKVVWGPVYAKDIAAFLKNHCITTAQMRAVRFPWLQRAEMAAAWAFSLSLLAVLIVAPFRPETAFALTLLICGLSFLIFLSFPIYGHLLKAKKKRMGFIFFDFGMGVFQLILWTLLLLGVIVYGVLGTEFSWQFYLRWSLISLIAVLILSIDLMGSTPLYKSSIHEDSLLKVRMDENKCKGAGICEQVCPRNCYALDPRHSTATMPGANRCVQCGACIVQCPCDALYFSTPKGEIIPPATIRKYKLNLLGKRLTKAQRK